MVQRIYNNSQNLLTMINEVLDFSKIEAGQMKLHSEAFNLANLIQITVEELRSLAVQKNLTLEVDIDLENPLVINDQNYCRRIFINLLANALKFTSNGGVWIKVWAVNSEKVTISVKDTGIGIDSKHLETIFEPFRQVDQTTTRKYSGTGLGLAISYSQVKMMQGQITVESKLGQGSIFKVEIPRQVKFSSI
jgi:signal transduction histidine kinase